MTVLIITLVMVAIAALAIYRLGRTSKTVDVLKSEVATGEKTNEILQKQRDGQISNANDADSFWMQSGTKED